MFPHFLKLPHEPENLLGEDPGHCGCRHRRSESSDEASGAKPSAWHNMVEAQATACLLYRVWGVVLGL